MHFAQSELGTIQIIKIRLEKYFSEYIIHPHLQICPIVLRCTRFFKFQTEFHETHYDITQQECERTLLLLLLPIITHYINTQPKFLSHPYFSTILVIKTLHHVNPTSCSILKLWYSLNLSYVMRGNYYQLSIREPISHLHYQKIISLNYSSEILIMLRSMTLKWFIKLIKFAENVF